jgi:hypothetical protein
MDPAWTDAPPLLFVLGTEDKVIPPERSRRAFELATYPKGKLELPGAGHDLREPVRTPVVSDSTKAFFARFLDGQGDGLDGIRDAVRNDPNNPDYDHDWRLDSRTSSGTSVPYSYEHSGQLDADEGRTSYRLRVTDSRLRARLSFDVAGVPASDERAVMTLRDPEGAVVKKVRGDSVLRLREGVDGGVYRLSVKKPRRHSGQVLSYTLDVAPRRAA